jgi:hypothetical protein
VPRYRRRVCLQDGLKLDLNRLARKGFIRPGARTPEQGIGWANFYWGEIAVGAISADMSARSEGWLRITLRDLDQHIMLVAKPRYYGGYQWYFVCPATYRIASVLWRPPGAKRFCSRQAWRGQVAYGSQFNDATNRAHAGIARIKARLIGDLDPDEWDLPPKPKRMRWKTYNRLVERFDEYEAKLDYACALLAAKLTKLKLF